MENWCWKRWRDLPQIFMLMVRRFASGLRLDLNLEFGTGWSDLGAVFILFKTQEGRVEYTTKALIWDRLTESTFNQFLWLRNFSLGSTEDCDESYCSYTWNIISFKCDYNDILHRALGKIVLFFSLQCQLIQTLLLSSRFLLLGSYNASSPGVCKPKSSREHLIVLTEWCCFIISLLLCVPEI